ncbi:hypothetical protein [Marisediminicola senii]|uniref:hypothetical protein n=1 Tax=Marisediminicola senii TaxID=2711233 RepID=UPI0013EC5303|nr:hypothetical protein [Marisediminicola senii]
MTDNAPRPADPSGAGATPDGQAPPAPTPGEPASTVDTRRVTVRRAPKYPRFIIIGAGLAAIITFILTAIYPVDPEVGFGALFGYFALIAVPIGAAIGGLVAVLLDVVATRRAKQFEAEHTTVDALPEEVDGDLED